MASSPSPDPRILILGLSDPSFPDGGPGGYMARSLRVAFPEIEVEETPASGPDFPRILSTYDMIVILDCISMCSAAGQVLVVSPYALAGLKGDWDDYARALERAIHDMRLFGRRIPAIHIVAVCMPDRDVSSEPQVRALAAMYRALVPRAKQIVKDLIREARTPET